MLDKNTVVQINCLINTSRQWAVADNAFSFRFPIEPNKEYIISASNASESVFRAGVASTEELPTADNPVSLTSVTRRTNTNTPITVTTDASSKYIVIQLSVAQAETTLNTLTIQETKTYPITLPSGMELCKIGDYQDYIYKGGNDWYKHKEIGKLFVKDLEWSKSSTNPDDTNLIMFVSDGDSNRKLTGTLYPLCNYLSYTGMANAAVNGKNKGVGFWFYYNDNLPERRNIFIILPKTVVSKTAELITWATTNNVVLYYELEEPVEEPITDTTLIAQLEAMTSAEGYNGITYITTTNENALAIIPVFFYNKISEGIRVSRNRTRIIVQRKKKPDITLELEIGALELVNIDNNYQDRIYKEDNKWYVSKKTAKISSYAGESISTPYISSKTTLETGALVYYGIPESITEITDTDLIEQLDSILDIELDREETSFEQEVDRFDLKMILYIKAYERKVNLEIQEVDRIIGFVDNLDAIKQAVYHILMTERYAYLIYDNNYGVELDQYIGRGFDYLESGIEQTLREALLQDLRITNVFVTDIVKNSDDSAHIYFEVQSIYGNLQMEVNVNV